MKIAVLIDKKGFSKIMEVAYFTPTITIPFLPMPKVNIYSMDFECPKKIDLRFFPWGSTTRTPEGVELQVYRQRE